VELQGKKSRWRTQKNGLVQGSILAPLLFNIYTNDKPTPLGTQRFIYAIDLALTSQNHSFEDNWLKPKPNKIKHALSI